MSETTKPANAYREPGVLETNYDSEVFEEKNAQKLANDLNEWFSNNPLVEIVSIILLSRIRGCKSPWEVMLAYKKVGNYKPEKIIQVKQITEKLSNGLKHGINRWFKNNPQCEVVKMVKLDDAHLEGEDVNCVLIFYETKI